MSTIQGVQLRQQAHDALSLLAQAQYQLLVVRERQIAEAERESECSLESERQIEVIVDAACDDVAKLALAFGVGAHGTMREQLTRIGEMHEAVVLNLSELQRKLTEVEGKLQAALLRGVVDSEVERIPFTAGDLPYNSRQLAAGTMAAWRERRISPSDIDEECLQAFLACVVMRGYDEHARKYGKLIELAIMGERAEQGDVYTAEAELQIAVEADKHVDPGAPPKGWKPADERTF